MSETTLQRVRLFQVKEESAGFGDGNPVSRPALVVDAVRPFYEGRAEECMAVFCVDAQNRPTCWAIVAQGNLNSLRATPREVFVHALLSNALGVILIHNHPSGNLEPSHEDIEFTRAIKKAGEILMVEVFDHIIITDAGFTSLRERGLVS